MKGILFVIVLCCSGTVTGQNLTFFFGGQISNFDSGKKEGGVTVAIVVGGKSIESTITASNGKYTLKKLMPANSVFDVVISKPGFVAKKVTFNYSTMDMSTVKEGLTMDPVGALNLEIFAERAGADFSFLQTDPVTSFKYNPAQMAVVNDAAMTQRVKQKIEAILKQAEDKEDAEKNKYLDAIKKADGLFTASKYEEALPVYQQAAAMQAKEIHPQNRIREIEALLKAQAKEKMASDQKEKDYQNLITAADNLKNAKKYPEAIANYTEALKIKQEAYPKDEIKKLEALIAEEKNSVETDRKFGVYISAGDAAMIKKDYTSAKLNYENAARLKEKELYPKSQITKIDQLVAEMSSAANSRQKYDALIVQADNLLKQAKFEEAKLKYQEAQKVLSSEAYPLERIKFCDDQISKLSADTQKTERITKLFEDGQKLMDTKKYNEAKLKYKEIQQLDPTKSLAQVKLDEIDRLIASNEKEKNKEADFASYVSIADGYIKARKLEEAKQNYGAALEIKEDATVREKYNKTVSDLAVGQAKTLVTEKYNNAMSVAEKLMAQGKLGEARVKFSEAAVLDETQTAPKEKIAQIDKMLGNNAEVDKKYNDFIKKGDKLVQEEKYLEAIREFNNALSLKPYEVEPKRKATEAENLEKAKNNEADDQFEKIISTAITKIEEKEYDRAIELLKRAQGFRPEDKRPVNLLRDIEKIKRDEKLYRDKIAQGENAMNAKDYTKALAMYSDASRIKPEEKLPISKMEELNRLMTSKSNQSQQDKLFNDYFSKGMSALGVYKYDNALESFKLALKVKPDSQITKDKIAEINQILDDKSKALASNLEQQKVFEEWIKKADGSFKARDYQKSLEFYEEAAKVDSKNLYVNRQILECQKLLAREVSNENEKAYLALINEADNLLEKTELEKSKKKYQEALEMKKGEAYPLKKIEEIDAMLNPLIVGNKDLVPLGDKFEGDAELALAKADLDRKNVRNGSIDDVRRITINKNDSLSSENQTQNQESTSTIFSVETKVAQIQDEAKQDLMAKDTKIKEVTKTNDEVTGNISGFNENKRQTIKGNISQVEGGREEYGEAQSNRLNAENYGTNLEIGIMVLKEEAKTERLDKSQQVKGSEIENMVNQLSLEEFERGNTVKENQAQLNRTQSIVTAVNELQNDKNTSFTATTTENINETVIESYSKTSRDNQISRNNSEDVNGVSKRSDEINQSINNKLNFEANITTANVDQIRDRISVEDDYRDQRRERAVLQIQENQNNLDEMARMDFNKQMEKQLTAKNNVANQEKNIYEQSTFTQNQQKGNSVDIESIKSQARLTEELVATRDDLDSKRTSLGVGLVISKVNETN
ncbi:MAG: hypothetical protein KJ941_12840, partial [Bacteroidetes bacterium]|nr:hypothetical protein [Bacteroidota bacterium]